MIVSSSVYTWKAKDSDVQLNDYYRIEGDELYLHKSDVINHFTCKLSVDVEFGPISLDLEVNPSLLDRAFEKKIVAIDTQDSFNEANDEYNVDCIPGENCE